MWDTSLNSEKQMLWNDAKIRFQPIRNDKVRVAGTKTNVFSKNKSYYQMHNSQM